MPDKIIEQIEADLRESQFGVWEVEKLLAKRHQARIDALTKTESTARRRGQIAYELVFIFLAFVGFLTIGGVAGAWLLAGDFPLQQVPPQAPPAYQIEAVSRLPAGPAD